MKTYTVSAEKRGARFEQSGLTLKEARLVAYRLLDSGFPKTVRTLDGCSKPSYGILKTIAVVVGIAVIIGFVFGGCHA